MGREFVRFLLTMLFGRSESQNSSPSVVVDLSPVKALNPFQLE